MTRTAVFAPFEIVEGDRSRGLVLVADHARRDLPEEYGDLGLPAGEFDRHIAYDIGVERVTKRLAALTGDHAWREKADRLFDGVLAAASDNLFSHAALLNALDLRLNAIEIVVTGADHQRFAEAALKLPHLNRIVLRAPPANALPASHPAQAKIAASRESAAFVCIGERCSLPVTEPERIAEAVAAMHGSGS